MNDQDMRYHITFQDGDSGESLGLMLAESRGGISFSRNLVNPYAAKMGSGATRDSDLTEWSLISWRDWRGGRGQEDMSDPIAYYDSHGLDTRIQGQITLGPLPIQPNGTYPKYEPGATATFVTGYPVAEMHRERPNPGSAQLGQDGISLIRGQRFLVQDTGGDTTRNIKQIDLLLSKPTNPAPTSGLRVSIYSDSDGLPNAELTYKTIAAGDVSTTMGWVTVALDTAYTVTPGTYYWIVVTATLGNIFYWYGSGDYYDDGYMGLYDDSGWNTSLIWKNYDFNFRIHYNRLARSQSFETPAAGMTCTSVQLYLQKIGHPGTYTVGLHADDGGKPAAATLKTTTIDGDTDVGTTMGWVQATWDAGQVLAGATTYHITLTPSATEVLGGSIMWGANSSGGYTDGASNRKIASGAWANTTCDYYFRTNTEALDNDVIAFEEYDGDWFVAAGDTVYVWDSTDEEWDVSDQLGGKDVTALEAWGDWLWAARGNDNVLRRFNGTTWSDVAVRKLIY